MMYHYSMEGGILGAVALLVGILVLISMAPLILGNTDNGCRQVPGYDVEDPAKSTGWAKECLLTANTGQTSFNIVAIFPLIIAAIAVVLAVRYF